MTTMYQSEFDELARALATLLATWWRYRDRTDEANQSREPVAQHHLVRLGETTPQARAPPKKRHCGRFISTSLKRSELEQEESDVAGGRFKY
jgi:hypothetical protein